MATYKDLVEMVIKRELGILGKERMQAVLQDLRMPVDGEGRCMMGNCNIDDLERLMQALSERYGAVAVMGCKIAVGRIARDANLELPKILK